jgi:hypothetical protein
MQKFTPAIAAAIVGALAAIALTSATAVAVGPGGCGNAPYAINAPRAHVHKSPPTAPLQPP